jgi:hypothetical protein
MEAEHPTTHTEHDRESGNVMLRAGYMHGLALKATEEHRTWLHRAARSLRLYAVLLETVGASPLARVNARLKELGDGADGDTLKGFLDSRDALMLCQDEWILARCPSVGAVSDAYVKAEQEHYVWSARLHRMNARGT